MNDKISLENQLKIKALKKIAEISKFYMNNY